MGKKWEQAAFDEALQALAHEIRLHGGTSITLTNTHTLSFSITLSLSFTLFLRVACSYFLRRSRFLSFSVFLSTLVLPGGQAEFRTSLALSFFYKFFVAVQQQKEPASVKPELQSASQKLYHVRGALCRLCHSLCFDRPLTLTPLCWRTCYTC